MDTSILGNIHSLESFGSADGPGVRYVIFLKGCKMRCKYCHNPDTWSEDGGMLMTVDDILSKAVRYKAYWKDNGGITVSGGEALLQIDFLIELFKKAKEKNINTTLDTSGNPFSRDKEFIDKFDELMKYTDLVMLDIKHIDDDCHKRLTGFTNRNILEMAEYLSDNNKAMWIRHVLVPGITDSAEHLTKLKEFIAKLNSVEKVEILPYHTLGVFKYEKLGIKYQLEEVNPPTNEQVEEAKRILDI